jgi:hypothetical protein
MKLETLVGCIIVRALRYCLSVPVEFVLRRLASVCISGSNLLQPHGKGVLGRALENGKPGNVGVISAVAECQRTRYR